MDVQHDGAERADMNGTSMTNPWSAQPRSRGVTAKWADEEIGRNSVIP
jgi:hypothetical protein